MPHHVYANNNEICAKSADGTSTLATDVCFSPGSPMPGVSVPYMNTCKASDVTNGSKTVFIKGMEVCLEDKSYFSTSYGDEPATQGMMKGTASNAVQGKCYFVGWSPNVMIEGLSVTRHLDMVTHNHSNPANTPPVYYLSEATLPADCKKDKERMEKRCKPEKAGKGKNSKGKRPAPNDKDGVHGSWVLDHCGPLLVKPGADFKNWMNEFGDLNKIMEQATSALKNDVIAKLEKEAAEFATKKAVAFAARRGLTGWIPIIGWVITAVDVVATGVEMAEKIPAMREQIGELKDIAGKLEESTKKITGTFDKFKDKLKNFDKLSPEEQKKVANEVMADVQSAYGAANPCMRARKCFLVPFNKTESEAASWKGDACCPGQTGHHLMPDAMFRDPSKAAQDKAFNSWKSSYGGKIPHDQLKPSDMPRDKKPKMKCWDNYTEAGAPTICLEGTDNTSGSHGAVHGMTAELMELHRAHNEMNYTKARDEMSTLINKVYGCNKKCLEAQLDEYYKKAYSCGDLNNAKVTPHSGMSGGGPKPPSRDGDR